MRHPFHRLAVACAISACVAASCSTEPTAVDSRLLTATLDVASGPAGVALTLAITNPHPLPVQVQFGSGQQHDFTVARPDGTIVWTWSADKGFTQALTSRTLAPGERVTYSANWTPTAPGAYRARGSLTSFSHEAEAAAAFVVP